MKVLVRVGLLAGILLLAVGIVACGGDANTEPVAEEPVEEVEQVDEPEVYDVHEVSMLVDGEGFRYDPKELTIQHGDKVVWTMESGAPHDVSFRNMDIPEGAEEVLKEHGVYQGPELNAPGETYEIHFTEDFPTGTYEYICEPHAASDMIGYLTIEEREEG